MKKVISRQFYACGSEAMPGEIVLGDRTYILRELLKNDFFAATGVYDLGEVVGGNNNGFAKKVIVKRGREQGFFGVPLGWLGSMISGHEKKILRHLGDVEQVPKLLSDYGKSGFVYEYIEGTPLDMVKEVPEGFFDELRKLLSRVHRKRVAYLDMNKRGNIIVGDDGLPYLIDFQISQILDVKNRIFRGISRVLRESLQDADLYHFFKHKKKFCPDSLKPDESPDMHRGWMIRWHRRLTRPYRFLRRRLLRYMYRVGILASDSNISYRPEDDPARYAK